MFKRVRGDADAMFKRAKSLQGSVKVGFLASGMNKYPNGEPVAHVAQYHEFGTATIPSRPFMRLGIRRFNSDGGRVRKALAGAVVDGKLPRDAALGLMGAKARDAIVGQINSGTPPPLDPVTIATKGSSTPLIDTGLLKQSVNWEVE